VGQWYVTTQTQSLIFSQSPSIHHFRPIYLAFLCCLTQLNLQTIPHSYHGPTVIVTNVLHEANSRENLPLAHCLLTGLYLTISTLARWSRFRSGSIEIYTEWNKGPKTKRLSLKTPHKNIWFFSRYNTTMHTLFVLWSVRGIWSILGNRLGEVYGVEILS